MPNYCSYSMMVKGEKTNIEEFVKIIKADYDYSKEVIHKHLSRVFDAECSMIDECGDNIYKCTINGCCAWSVHSCMFSGEHSYYNLIKEQYGEDSKVTTVPILSEELDLDIEIYSEESDMGFQEHYMILKGKIIIDECVDYGEIWTEDYESVENLNEENDTNFTQEEFESHDFLSNGGFEWEFNI